MDCGYAVCGEDAFWERGCDGKVVRIDNKDNYTVTGIVKDPPNNPGSHFDYLLPWAYTAGWK